MSVMSPFGYNTTMTSFVADQAQESMQLLQEKSKQLEAEKKHQENADDNKNGTGVFSAASGNGYSAAGAWSESNIVNVLS